MKKKSIDMNMVTFKKTLLYFECLGIHGIHEPFLYHIIYNVQRKILEIRVVALCIA